MSRIRKHSPRDNRCKFVWHSDTQKAHLYLLHSMDETAPASTGFPELTGAKRRYLLPVSATWSKPVSASQRPTIERERKIALKVNMGQLRHFVRTNVAFIGMLLFCARVAEATGQDAITSMPSNALDIEIHNNFTMKVHDNGCECIEYNCGCCQHLEWNAVSMDGKLCINASYLNNDYGISLTVTYNNFAIFNETISARNPPPICFGEDIVDAVDVEICLHVYDIDVTSDKFHACFEILGKLMKLPITKIKLGCVQTKLHKEIKYIENNWLSIFVKKTEDSVPKVIIV